MARRYVFSDEDLPDPPAPWVWRINPADPSRFAYPPGGADDWVELPSDILAIEVVTRSGGEPAVELSCRDGVYQLRQWESADTLCIVKVSAFRPRSFQEAVEQERNGLIRDIQRSEEANWSAQIPREPARPIGPPDLQSIGNVLKDVYGDYVRQQIEDSPKGILSLLDDGGPASRFSGEPGQIIRYAAQPVPQILALDFSQVFYQLQNDPERFIKQLSTEDVQQILALPPENRIRNLIEQITSALPKK